MTTLKFQKGFTLIELVIVIIILGILAVTAAPKFINVSKEARIATLNGLAGTFRSSVQLIHAKAQIKNLVNLSGYQDLDYNGSPITIRYGYFAYHPNFARAEADVALILDVDFTNDWDSTFEPGGAGGIGAHRSRISPKGLNDVTNIGVITQINRCYVEYVLPTVVGESPTFNIDEDC